MRILVCTFIFLVTSICYSQDLVTGFYMESDSVSLVNLINVETEEVVGLEPKPIFTIDNIQSMTKGFSMHNEPVIIFKLDVLGAEFLKKVSKEANGRRMALVIDDKVLSTAYIYFEISGGVFELSGIDLKKQSAMLNKLQSEKQSSNKKSIQGKKDSNE